MSYFVSVSGGLDSTALSIICSADKKRNWKYIFADTGDEFPQVYDHLDKMEKTLGIEIIRVRNEEYTLEEYERQKKFFPSPVARFCTRMFKIQPIEKYLANYKPFKLAIGLRADEDRKGNVEDYAIYPLKEMNIQKCDVLTICQSRDLVPQYPWYMSRGGCYSCFYKSQKELKALAKYEPDLFMNLVEREEAVQDNREKYFTMFDRWEMPLRRVYEEVQKYEQIDMFDQDLSGKMTYETNDCGVFCRK